MRPIRADWGDVVLARKEMPTSYNLAVVLDDALQGVTHVVRGRDLFEATSVHRLLQELLGLPQPSYHHHRLILGPGRAQAVEKRCLDRPSIAARKWHDVMSRSGQWSGWMLRAVEPDGAAGHALDDGLRLQIELHGFGPPAGFRTAGEEIFGQLVRAGAARCPPG